MCSTHYSAHRRRQIAYGRWNPRVPADAVRAHVEAMSAAGVNANQLAKLSGVSQPALSQIMAAGPDKKVAAWVEAAVLAVSVPERAAEVTTDTALVPILGARRRFQALVASGYPAAQLARELGTARGNRTIRSLMGQRADRDGRVTQEIAAERERAVKALFDRLQLVPGPSAQARALGKRHGWPLPIEWDEHAIDDPNARPVQARWTPASAREERREQVVELTARGLSEDQIAERLGINARLVARDRAYNSRKRELAERHAPQDNSRDIATMAQVAAKARADLAVRRSPVRSRAIVRSR
ncbi:helix-turn-helix domain-containing protein [Nocardia sp. NPDC056000]|uniref:helix-turn-helix domain-containing protein n=1 Tax=Nocardia sp. NPDC056000 TaxID=3345674 RepID=UPI0035D79F2C